MGYLDTNGLKKVVNRIKSEINDKVNNIKIPDAGQKLWTYISSTNYEVYLYPYHIHDLLYLDKNANIYFNKEYLPNTSDEYKVRSKGRYLNNIIWPSVFDMPWPNNEIPVFEEYKEYEIYIAGGIVVSVTDISAPVEEVTYIIESNQEIEFNINISNSGILYINEISYKYSGNFNQKLNSGINVVRINGNISDIMNISFDGEYTYLKVDCSKMKSNNFHIITNGLKIDDIIYPQACVGDISAPRYNFEAPDLDFTFLAKNDIGHPSFGDLISNRNLNKILNLDMSTGSSEVDNTQFLGRVSNYTVGTFSDGVTNFEYANMAAKVPKYVGYRATGNVEQSFIIRSEEFSMHIATHQHVTIVGETELFGYIPQLYSNISFEGIVSGKIYYSSNQGFDERFSLYPDIDFILVSSFYEIPFKYAAYNLDDVKNFDENGNVVG